jgi:hypothetical protein
VRVCVDSLQAVLDDCIAAMTKESWEVPSWMDKERVKSSVDTIGYVIL